jgi:antitoxin CptB
LTGTAAAELNRLRWRCRRGMRELDVLLERYLRDHWPGADAGRRQAFQALLDLPDPELADLCLGRTIASDAALAAIVGEITHVAELSAGGGVYPPVRGRSDPSERDP